MTDNGLVFTARFAHGGRTSRNALENELIKHGILQKNSRPNHPTTCGKVERFHQTMKKRLREQPAVNTLAELQTQVLLSSGGKWNPLPARDRASARSAVSRCDGTLGTRIRVTMSGCGTVPPVTSSFAPSRGIPRISMSSLDLDPPGRLGCGSAMRCQCRPPLDGHWMTVYS